MKEGSEPFVNFSDQQRAWPADGGFGLNPKSKILNPKSPEAKYG
jgi:hypothetical protein